LHISEGTYRHDRHSARGVPVTGEPVKPDDLDKYGEQLWAGTIQELIDAGIVKKLDSLMVGELCRWYSAYRRALNTRQEKAYRRMVMAKMARNVVNAIATRFGMTPVDREKIRRAPSETDDPLAEWLNGG
jgi:phage terminase small subunit